MSPQDIIRAWKDEEFRHSLSEAKRALLPAHPAGLIELEDAELDQVAGGRARGARETTCERESLCCRYEAF